MNLPIKPLRAAVLAALALPPAAWALNAPTGADAYISTATATTTTTNYGGATSLRVAGGTAKTLLRFDLSALPAATTGNDVAKATLFIWVGTVNSAGALQVSEVASNWGEMAVTAGAPPTLGAIVATSLPAPASTVGYYVAADITNTVKTWVNTPGSNNGVVVEADAASPSTSVLIDSKESGGTSHPAYIEVATAKGVSSVGVTAPVTNSGTASAPVIGIPQAGASASGYLSSTDWSTFNSKGSITGVTAGAGLAGGGTSGNVTLNLPNTGVSAGSYTNANITVDAQGRVTAVSDGSASGGVTSVNVTAPVTNSGSSTAPNIGLPQASGSASGYLSSTDWTAFNNKGSVTNVTGSGPISVANGSSTPVISLPQANGSASGYLSSADWTAFNNKGSVTTVSASLPLSVAGSGSTPLISLPAANGSTNGYLSSADWTTFNNKGNGDITDVLAGSGLTGGGSSGSVTLSLGTVPSASLSGTYSNALTFSNASNAFTGSGAGLTSLTGTNINSGAAASGQVLKANGAGGVSWQNDSNSGGTVSSVATGTGLSGGPITGSGTISLATLSPSPAGTYTNATVTVDSTGRVTSAATGSGGGGSGPNVYQPGSGTALSNVKINIGTITPAATANTEATQTFGSAFTSAPVCTASLRQGTLQADNATNSNSPIVKITAVSTTTIGVTLSITPNGTNGGTVTPLIHFHCIGI